MKSKVIVLLFGYVSSAFADKNTSLTGCSYDGKIDYYVLSTCD
jgi:hypothetical protein